MATVERVVARALRLIQVINPRQPVQASDMQTAIEALNTMMARWEANSLSLGWSSVENPSDELPVPVEAEKAVAYNLALDLCPEYGTQPPAAVIASATVAYSELLRDQMVATPIRPILDVPTPDRRNGYGGLFGEDVIVA